MKIRNNAQFCFIKPFYHLSIDVYSKLYENISMNLFKIFTKFEIENVLNVGLPLEILFYVYIHTNHFDQRTVQLRLLVVVYF